MCHLNTAFVVDLALTVENQTTLDEGLRLTLNGGGFFLACEDFGRMFDDSFPA